MVGSDFTPLRGIRFERYSWGCFITGDREALIELGYVQAPLPGDPGENKWTKNTADPQGRPISVKRNSKRTFTIRRAWSSEEAAAFRVEEEKRKELEQASKLVASWPESADKFRKDSLFSVEFGLRMIDDVFCSGFGGGYRYDDAAIDRAKFLLDELRVLYETGSIVMDRTLRDQHTPALIAGTVRAADSAKMDKTFQRFLAGVAK